MPLKWFGRKAKAEQSKEASESKRATDQVKSELDQLNTRVQQALKRMQDREQAQCASPHEYTSGIFKRG